jgi:hypothetical protein
MALHNLSVSQSTCTRMQQNPPVFLPGMGLLDRPHRDTSKQYHDLGWLNQLAKRPVPVGQERLVRNMVQQARWRSIS